MQPFCRHFPENHFLRYSCESLKSLDLPLVPHYNIGTMKNILKILFLSAALTVIIGMTAFAANPTFSKFWYQTDDGIWHVKDENGTTIKNCWFCDDAVASNGKNIWYLIDKNGNMVSYPLVQDGTGNCYSLENNHDGYYGMLHYEDKAYLYDGESITLDVVSAHDGSFAAIENEDGIEALKGKYGLKTISIDNSNIVYSSDFKPAEKVEVFTKEADDDTQGPGATSSKGSGQGDLETNSFTFDGKEYEVDYDWGAHYISGYAPTGNRTASGTVPTAGRTIAGPRAMLGKICYIKRVSGKRGSEYDGVYRFEDTGGATIEYGRSDTLNASVIDIFCNSYAEAASITAPGWTTVEVYILKEK